MGNCLTLGVGNYLIPPLGNCLTLQAFSLGNYLIADKRAARRLEEKREEAWRAYDAASRDIDRQKDELLDEIGRRLEQRVEETPHLTMRWQLT